MSGVRHKAAAGRQWFVAIAALALFMQVLVPKGYMVSGDNGSTGFVICTGHGPLVIYDRDHPGEPSKQAPNRICPFAAHGLASTPPMGASAVSVVAERVTLPGVAMFDLAPGRGLAAPPPRSRAPPAFLI